MQILKILNLSYAYKQDIVLKDICLTYDNKDFLAIIGPNGGGKSTLIKLILGLLPSKNNIFLNGISKKEIAYVPQNINTNLNFPLRVLEVVLMGLIDRKIFGFYSTKEKQEAMLSLKKVGIEDLYNCNINNLSGGQRQRVFIARALVSKCRLLILDEPTASIDTKTTIQIFDLLSTLQKQGIGIIIVCHDINIVLAYADKIAYLNKELCVHDNQKNIVKLNELIHKTQDHFCDFLFLKES